MQELIDVIKVKANADFSLHLEFENGEKRVFDMTPYMDERPFIEIKGPQFLLASVDYGTVVWPGNIDISPETLYHRSNPA